MKTLSYAFPILFAAIITITACTKNGGFNAPVGQIAASKTKIKINEPDLFALVGADTTKVVNWDVTPGGSDALTNQRNAARIVFSKAGNYMVNASQTGAAPASIAITVIDSVWVPPITYITFDGSEQITMVPKYVASTKPAPGYLAFTATTKKTYCANSALDYGIFHDGFGDQGYYIQFAGVFIGAADCSLGSSVLTVHNDFSPYQNGMVNGSYPLHIFFNGKNRDGSIDVTSTTITFNWDDASGVVITPKQLSK